MTGVIMEKWLEKWLPFVAKSPEAQVAWLVRVLRKNILSPAEITPYIRLLLEPDDLEIKARIAACLRRLDAGICERLTAAAEIYDLPKLFAMLPAITTEQAMIALAKVPPPYEKNSAQVQDRLFHAVYNQSPERFSEAVDRLRQHGQAPAGFDQAHARFLDLLEDEKLLSALYPKARAKMEPDLESLL